MREILYISDLDGTLLNSSSKLSEYTTNTLNNMFAKGIDFSVATGRTTDAAEKIMAGVALKIPIASFNGVVIYDLKHKNYNKIFYLASETVKKMFPILKFHGVSWLMYELKDNELLAYYDSLEHKPIKEFIEDRKEHYNSSFCHVNDLNDVPLEQIMYFTLIDTYNRIKPVYSALKEIPDLNLTLVDDTNINGLWWLEIFSAEASKENAVVFLREKYGHKKVVCFGDNYNDLPMFHVCDTCIAVGNALDEIKAAADYICDSNDNDGVAKWLDENVK